MSEKDHIRRSINWPEFVHQRLALAEEETLERAHQAMLKCGADFAAVLSQDGSLLGMASFKHVASVLSAKYGQALFARRRLGETRVYGKVLGSTVDDTEALYGIVTPIDQCLVVKLDDDFFSAQRKFEGRKNVDFFNDLILVDERGRFVGLLSVRDFNRLQHRVIMEQEFELKSRNDELEETLQRLSRTQGELNSTAKMAALGEMVAGIAHEMNTPLGVILSSQHIVERVIHELQAQVLPSQRQKLLEMLSRNIEIGRDAGGRVSDILRSLRIFGRDDQEMLHEADLVGLIRSALILHSNKFKSRVDVRTNLPLRAPLRCFPGQISQVLVNVLTNAYQAMDGEGEIVIGLKSHGKYWLMEIRDNGPGFGDELDRVFDPGFTTKGVGVGTGLGLSISRKLIEINHSGKISVGNHEEGGALITIELPVELQVTPSDDKRPAEHEENEELQGAALEDGVT